MNTDNKLYQQFEREDNYEEPPERINIVFDDYGFRLNYLPNAVVNNPVFIEKIATHWEQVMKLIDEFVIKEVQLEQDVDYIRKII